MEMYFRSEQPPLFPDVTVINEEVVIACGPAECSVQYADGSGHTVSVIAMMRWVR